MAETSSLSYELSMPYSGCQWYDFVNNESICTTTGLADIRDVVRRRRLGLSGHVARFDHDVPAASALAVCCATSKTLHHQTRHGGDLGVVHDTRGYVKSARTLTCQPRMLLYWHRTEIRGEQSC